MSKSTKSTKSIKAPAKKAPAKKAAPVAKAKPAAKAAPKQGVFKVVNGRARSVVDGPVALVWNLAEKMTAKGATRGEVVAAAIDKGVTPNTARTQYQYWFTASKASA